MEIVICEAKPSDAQQLIAYVQRLTEEPGSNIELSPGEFTLTVPEEQKILTIYALSVNSVYLVAVDGEKIIGVISCTGRNRQAIRHVTTLSMSVDRSWRGKGIEGQLMAHAVEWARGTDIVSRIELIVFERNETAVHLYRKYGFEIEGRRQKAIFRDGEYLDDLMMALLL
jgi:RimJ/RimL family protein N-acetyltransferase